MVATDYSNLGTAGMPNYITMAGEAHDVPANAARAAFQPGSRPLDRSNVAVIGHSQGGHAALSAAYLAPEYAPDLSIKGSVAIAPAIFPPAPMLEKFITASPDSTTGWLLLGLSPMWSTPGRRTTPDRVRPEDVFTPKGCRP